MIGQKTTLILQQLTNVSDNQGGYIEKWSSIRRIKGVMEATRGDERFYGESRTLFASHMFYCDFPTGATITEKDRFVKESNGEILEIVFVVNTAEQNRFLEITLKEIV